MNLKIVLPNKLIYDGEILSVTVPGKGGLFTILSHHTPLIAILAKGNVTFRFKNGVNNVFINGGLIELNNDKVVICAEQIPENEK